MLSQFLSIDDSERAQRVSEKLLRHDISGWALTGGAAVELHCLRCGRAPTIRLLNDLDFIAGTFECIPRTLGDDFLFRHIHPFDPPGKTMLQLIDRDNALRIDVFRATDATIRRAFPFKLPFGTIRIVCVEDLVARTARLVLGITAGVAIPEKHANDFLRLAELVTGPEVQSAWEDHRKPEQPIRFTEALSLLQELIPVSGNLLVSPEYSKNTDELCDRCQSTAEFRLADPKVVFSILGYC